MLRRRSRPIRTLTPFQTYCGENRAHILAELGAAGNAADAGRHLGRMLCEQWTNLTDVERREYVDKAEEDLFNKRWQHDYLVQYTVERKVRGRNTRFMVWFARAECVSPSRPPTAHRTHRFSLAPVSQPWFAR